MKGKALFIGNSDGIGLAATRALLREGWTITGISRSESPVRDPSYRHSVFKVQDSGFIAKLKTLLNQNEPPDLCIYCAGIGELLNPAQMYKEVETIEVNLVGMVKTASVVIPLMVKRGR